jgi:hypothetical protein
LPALQLPSPAYTAAMEFNQNYLTVSNDGKQRTNQDHESTNPSLGTNGCCPLGITN